MPTDSRVEDRVGDRTTGEIHFSNMAGDRMHWPALGLMAGALFRWQAGRADHRNSTGTGRGD